MIYAILFVLSVTVDSLLPMIALFLPIFYFVSFLFRAGETIPIKELTLSMLGLQCMLTPYLYYNNLETSDIYDMAVPQLEYFNFIVPSFCAFSLGLYAIRDDLPVLSWYSDKKNYGQIGQILIIGGLIAEVLVRVTPGSLAFVMVLASYTKYIGAIYMLFSGDRRKYIWAFVAFVPLMIQAVTAGMFQNLLGWMVFVTLYLFFRHQPKMILKVGTVVVAAIGIYVLQSIKKGYREVIWQKEEKVSLMEKTDVLTQNYYNSIQNESTFSEERASENFVRFNQGYIISRVMDYTPFYEPYAEGSTILEAIYSSIVPRFLDPNKAKVGGEGGLYTRFTGYILYKGTSMDIGIMGEIYANFGPVRGRIFAFILGLGYALVIFYFFQQVMKDPQLLFWLPFIFLLIIRPENSFVPVFNHLTKASFLLFVMYRYYLRARKPKFVLQV